MVKGVLHDLRGRLRRSLEGTATRREGKKERRTIQTFNLRKAKGFSLLKKSFLSHATKKVIRASFESRRSLTSCRWPRKSSVVPLNPKSMPISCTPPTVAPEGIPLSPRKVSLLNSGTNSKQQPFSAQGSLSEVSVPSNAQRFKSSLRNLRKISNLTFAVVHAPASVLLKTAELWKDHIVAHFHGTCPPPGKIFADLNPV